MPTANARIGDTYDGVTFTTLTREEPPPVKSETDTLIDLLVTENVLTRAKADAFKARKK